ncbi:hypothetical protein [Piscinibacter sp.]|uniref:hypothetical protein n=1 Tax=Piscinibacter sp. TaxID=1903157 RepID=UPI002D7E85E7|nr:hypothetical protein [Albitalea sp.]
MPGHRPGLTFPPEVAALSWWAGIPAAAFTTSWPTFRIGPIVGDVVADRHHQADRLLKVLLEPTRARGDPTGPRLPALRGMPS